MEVNRTLSTVAMLKDTNIEVLSTHLNNCNHCCDNGRANHHRQEDGLYLVDDEQLMMH